MNLRLRISLYRQLVATGYKPGRRAAWQATRNMAAWIESKRYARRVGP